MKILIGALLLFAFSANAKIVTKNIEYKQGDAVLEGYLAFDSQGPAKKPGVLVIHDWKGVSANTKARAEQLAKLGFVAFAADIYGKGIRPEDQKVASATAGKYKSDRPLLRQRANAGLAELQKQKNVDPKKIAAIGYCFGGTTAIELARSGAEIAGVVSFHGGLDSPTPEDGKNIKAKVLALHGADDPFVPEKDLKAFEDELRSAKVDWQLVKYANAVHSFTIPDAGSDNSKGSAYNATADKRSWVAMNTFFKEIFSK